MLILIGSYVLRLFLLAAVGCNVVSAGDCGNVDKDASCVVTTKFLLFTRSNRTDGQDIHVAGDNIAGTHFNAANPTKIIIHDFMDQIREPSHFYIRTEYLKKGEYNLIMVDWGWLARGPEECFERANDYTAHVGKCTAEMIQQLRRRHKMTDVHVIGLGLGAVVINSIAKKVNPKLTRATVLDPYGERCDTKKCVQIDPPKQSDADFVDVIHTNFKGERPLGTIKQVGHVDYYVNYVTFQPGCGNDYKCTHRRSILFFTESINIGKGFYGNQCKSIEELKRFECSAAPPRKILMGEYALKTTRGVVFVPTANQSPYSLGP